jgi:hypothetical protein
MKASKRTSNTIDPNKSFHWKLFLFRIRWFAHLHRDVHRYHYCLFLLTSRFLTSKGAT